MRSVRNLRSAIVACGLASLGSAANAGLLGDTVSVELSTYKSWGLQTVLVEAGEEGRFFCCLFFDFTDNGFAVRSSFSFPGGIDTNLGPIATWELTDLNMGAAITGVNVTQPFSDISYSFTDTSVTLTYADIGIPTGDLFAVEFLTRL